MLAGIPAKCPAHLGWVGLLFQLLDRLPLPDRLAMGRVLKPFDHCLEVREAFLHGAETLRYVRFPSVPESSPFEPPSETLPP